MISSDLLFQVEPIYTINSVDRWDFLILALIAGVFSMIFRGFLHWKSPQTPSVLHKGIILPQVDAADFEQKIALILRQKIEPENLYSDAHTAREIAHKKDHILLPLLKHIEQQEYIGSRIDILERREILDHIRKEL